MVSVCDYLTERALQYEQEALFSSSFMHEKKKIQEISSMGGIFTFGREDAISSMGLAEASSGDKLKVSRSSLQP